MILSGRRKDITDSNNYIGKYGTITHICPKCNKLYKAKIKLNIECVMEDSEGYSVSTSEVRKICSCGTKTKQIDNNMGNIEQVLRSKNYFVISSCEGHIYNREEITYDFPYIEICGDITSIIPSEWFNEFNIGIKIEFNMPKTIIRSKNNNCVLCLRVFNEYKDEQLDKFAKLADALPRYSSNNNSTQYGDCSCYGTRQNRCL